MDLATYEKLKSKRKSLGRQFEKATPEQKPRILATIQRITALINSDPPGVETVYGSINLGRPSGKPRDRSNA